jgi:hypothetical protein
VDRLPQLLTNLLDCAERQLSIPVCRSFVATGPNVPWDSCEVSDDGTSIGQLWVAQLWETPDWPSPTGNPKGCWPANWTAQIELGITRCQLGKPDDDGYVDPNNITLDAAQQQVDRYELMTAIICCWGVSERDIVFDRWEALEPRGGCIASRWLLRVRVGTCNCETTS